MKKIILLSLTIIFTRILTSCTFLPAPDATKIITQGDIILEIEEKLGLTNFTSQGSYLSSKDSSSKENDTLIVFKEVKIELDAYVNQHIEKRMWGQKSFLCQKMFSEKKVRSIFDSAKKNYYKLLDGEINPETGKESEVLMTRIAAMDELLEDIENDFIVYLRSYGVKFIP